MIITYRYRVKDKTSAKHLRRMAGAVNYAWNYCCQIQREAESRWRNGANARWPSRFDFVRLMTGSSVELGIHSDTLGAVARQFVDSRDAYRRCPAFRSRQKSNLGWVTLMQPEHSRLTRIMVLCFCSAAFIAFGFPAHSTAG